MEVIERKMFRVRNAALKNKPLGMMDKGKWETLKLCNIYRNGKKKSTWTHSCPPQDYDIK